jgi:hypothetical protein
MKSTMALTPAAVFEPQCSSVWRPKKSQKTAQFAGRFAQNGKYD